MADDQSNWDAFSAIAPTLLPPQAPGPEDGQIMLDMACAGLDPLSQNTVVLLGLTPQIAGLDWPGHVALTAIDGSQKNITDNWAGHDNPRTNALCAPWEALPFDDGAIDLIVGDCSLNALGDAGSIRRLVTEFDRVLRPEGQIIVRAFMRGEDQQGPEAVCQAARERKYQSVRSFKFDLALAVSREQTFFDLYDVSILFEKLCPSLEDFARQTGWDDDEMARLAPPIFFQHLNINYPNFQELRDFISPHFEILESRSGSYEMAQNCPTLRMARRPMPNIHI